MNKLCKHVESFKELADKYKLFIFDCDGVIWNQFKFIDYCQETLTYLHENSKLIQLLTNNSLWTKETLQDPFLKSENLKTAISKEQIFSASSLVCLNIKNNYPEIKKLYVIGADDLSDIFIENGYEVIRSSRFNNKINMTSDEIDEDCCPDNTIDGVVVGLDYNFNYYKMCYAMRILSRSETKLFGANIEYKVKGKNGYKPATYCLIKSIETSSGRTAEIVSKPFPHCIDLLLSEARKKQNIERNEVLMIGDSLYTDIKFANNVDIDSLLVLTGSTTKFQIEQLPKENEGQPTYILNDLRL